MNSSKKGEKRKWHYEKEEECSKVEKKIKYCNLLPVQNCQISKILNTKEGLNLLVLRE